jgi:hypothetical protein
MPFGIDHYSVSPKVNRNQLAHLVSLKQARIPNELATAQADQYPCRVRKIQTNDRGGRRCFLDFLVGIRSALQN